MYHTVLFDLDGTITQSEFGIIESAIYALKKFGIEVEDQTELLKFIGPPLFDSFRQFYHFSDEKAEMGVRYFREYYEEDGYKKAPLFPGIYDLFKDLKEEGIEIMVATSKVEEMAKKVLGMHDLLPFITKICGPSRTDHRSDKSFLMERCLEGKTKKERKKAIMVGDRYFDIEGAKKVGIDVIGVLYGYGSKEELETAGATYLAKDAKELYRIIHKEGK